MPLNVTDDFDDELLSAYLDGELTAAERALVEERLRTDPCAAALVEELRSLSHALQALPRQTLGRDLRASVQAAADKARADLASRQSPATPLPPIDRWAGVRRGLVWSALAIAATIVVAIVQPLNQAPEDRDVAKARREAAPEKRSEGPQRLVAANDSFATEASDQPAPLIDRGGQPPGPVDESAARAPAIAAAPSSGEAKMAAGAVTATNEGFDVASRPAEQQTMEHLAEAEIAAKPTMQPPMPELLAARPALRRRDGESSVDDDAAQPAWRQIVTLKIADSGGVARFERLLADNDIALDGADAEPADHMTALGALAAPTSASSADERPSSLTASPGQPGFDMQQAPPTKTAVLVEATPRQIARLIADCRADDKAFLFVDNADLSHVQSGGGLGGESSQALPSSEQRRFVEGRMQAAESAQSNAPADASPLASDDSTDKRDLTEELSRPKNATAMEKQPRWLGRARRLLLKGPEAFNQLAKEASAPAKDEAANVSSMKPVEQLLADRAQYAAADETRVRVLFMLEPSEQDANGPSETAEK